jgi:hypothetical protein
LEGDDADGTWQLAQSFEMRAAARLRRNPLGAGGDDFERGALSHRNTMDLSCLLVY